jgi:hypothetical protein
MFVEHQALHFAPEFFHLQRNALSNTADAHCLLALLLSPSTDSDTCASVCIVELPTPLRMLRCGSVTSLCVATKHVFSKALFILLHEAEAGTMIRTWRSPRLSRSWRPRTTANTKRFACFAFQRRSFSMSLASHAISSSR